MEHLIQFYSLKNLHLHKLPWTFFWNFVASLINGNRGHCAIGFYKRLQIQFIANKGQKALISETFTKIANGHSFETLLLVQFMTNRGH